MEALEDFPENLGQQFHRWRGSHKSAARELQDRREQLLTTRAVRPFTETINDPIQLTHPPF